MSEWQGDWSKLSTSNGDRKGDSQKFRTMNGERQGDSPKLSTPNSESQGVTEIKHFKWCEARRLT